MRAHVTTKFSAHSCVIRRDERKRLIGRIDGGLRGGRGGVASADRPESSRYPPLYSLVVTFPSFATRRVRAIFELPFSLCLFVSLCLSRSLSLSLPLDPPNWSSAVHSGKQGSTSVPRWFSVHTTYTGEGCASYLPRVSPPLSRADGYARTCLDV